jgi:hypothetical protein
MPEYFAGYVRTVLVHMYTSGMDLWERQQILEDFRRYLDQFHLVIVHEVDHYPQYALHLGYNLDGIQPTEVGERLANRLIMVVGSWQVTVTHQDSTMQDQGIFVEAGSIWRGARSSPRPTAAERSARREA